MTNLIPLTEYARNLGKSPDNARQLANRGAFKTAKKVGRDWMVNPSEKWPDRRLKSKDVFTKEGAEALTAEERRFYLKVEQAKEYSGWRNYPSTCSAIFENIPEEWWNKYTAKQIGEIAALLKAVYDKGVQYGRDQAE